MHRVGWFYIPIYGGGNFFFIALVFWWRREHGWGRGLPRGGARGRDGIFNGCSCGYNDKRREYVETTGSMYNNDDSLFTTRTEAKPTRALVVSLSRRFVLCS